MSGESQRNRERPAFFSVHVDSYAYQILPIHAIQVLRNAIGGGVYGSSQIRVTKVHGPTLFALQGGRGAKLAEKLLRNTWMAPNRRFLP